MMNAPGRPPAAPRKSDRLQRVLQTIGATSGVESPIGVTTPVAEDPANLGFPKLLATDEAGPETATETVRTASDDVLQSPLESARQIQQLADRLKRTEAELEQREARWQQRMDAWQRTREASEASLDQRWQQLHQQAAQVRIQQRHVMQLQQDIVRSYEAVKRSVEALVDREPGAPWPSGDQASLHHEIGQRFDYIARRWEHLYGLLEQQRVGLLSAQGVDDSVRWAG